MANQVTTPAVRGPDSSTTPSSRDLERVIAGLRFEMDPGTGGCSSFEILERLLDHVREDMLACSDDPSDAEMADLRSTAHTLAEFIVRGLAAAGRLRDAEGFVEDEARMRRECAARFGAAGPVPVTDAERADLSAAWDMAHRAGLANSPDAGDASGAGRTHR